VALRLEKSVYRNHNDGADCPVANNSAGRGQLAKGKVGTPITWCFEVTNTGGSYLDQVQVSDPTLGIARADLQQLDGEEPLAPGASMYFYHDATITGSFTNTASGRAKPTDPQGNVLPGLSEPTSSDPAKLEIGADVPRLCHHLCPDRIRFGKGGAALDGLWFVTAFPTGTLVDPLNEALSVTLSNANGTVYTASIPAGSMTEWGGYYRYTNPAARLNAGGFAKVKLYYTPDRQNLRLYAQAFGDLSAATLADMTLTVTLGDDTVVTTGIWNPTSSGWVFNHQ
jgi:hypothetical protein